MLSRLRFWPSRPRGRPLPSSATSARPKANGCTASTICNLFRRYPVSSTGISEIGSKAHSGNRDRNLQLYRLFGHGSGSFGFRTA
jgi:hypothetical protein